MKTQSQPPANAYGILRQETSDGAVRQAAEQVRRMGYAVLDPGLSENQIQAISSAFDRSRQSYVEHWGETHLREVDEHNSVRLPMAIDPGTFVDLALNPVLLELIGKLINGAFILGQQNGVINPVEEGYNQGFWHRDLPYQHYTSSTPLAVNALYCIDDFTIENGSTWVLPASHKSCDYPSEPYISNNALQVTARAGQYIILDCMTYHSGGFNSSQSERRAVNHVFTIPYFKQQIRIAGNIDDRSLTAEQRKILGFDYLEPASVSDFLAKRRTK